MATAGSRISCRYAKPLRPVEGRGVYRGTFMSGTADLSDGRPTTLITVHWDSCRPLKFRRFSPETVLDRTRR